MACADCFLEHHKYSPFHWAQQWSEKGYFNKLDLSSVRSPSLDRNYTVTFGHRNGGDCGRASYDNPIPFTVVDTTGIHATRAVFCRCPNAPIPRLDLLLASQIFPATFKSPTIGFTFNVLRDFHQHTLSSKKSAYDYVDALTRKTNFIFPHKVPDIYRQFLRAQRYWRAVSALISSGQCHGIDDKFPHRPAGNIIPPCFACPEPGFNMPLDDWENVDEDMDHVQLPCLMLDGHFGLQRLAKVDDPDDQSLLAMLGAEGLFPADAQYNEFLQKTGAAESPEKSTCSNFAAVNMQNRYKFKNCVITGVVGAQCACHCSFISLVDLQAGEKYANTDFTLARAIRRVIGVNALKRAKYFNRVVVTYDVACQYSVHVGERLKSGFPDISDVIDKIKMYVPKFHLEGHKEDCKFRYALEFFARAGRLHGEGIEQTWSEAKQAGGYTRHMNHGHRHDTLTDISIYWNVCKTIDQPSSLRDGLRVARVKRAEFIDNFLGMSVTHGREKVNLWEGMSTEPRLEEGEWTSVFRVSAHQLPSQEAVYQDLLKAEKAVNNEQRVEGGSSAQATFIHAGIKIQQRLADLTELTGESRAKEEASLRSALRQWRKQQARLMPLIENHVTGMKDSADDIDNLHDEILHLPSDIDARDHARYALTELAIIETRLREGQANDAITLICQGIKHKMVLLKDKWKQANSVQLNTRSLAWVKGTAGKIQGWATDYRRARLALLQLNGSKSLRDFPPLVDQDLTFKNAVNARELGSGLSTDSWIWSFGSLRTLQGRGLQEHMDKVDRAQWFRARADMMCWVEEVEMLEAEFRRVICALDKMSWVWRQMAEESAHRHPRNPGYAAYARQQAAMYLARKLDAEQEFDKAAGAWKPSDMDLSSWLRSRRPRLSVDWDAEARNTRAYTVQALVSQLV